MALGTPVTTVSNFSNSATTARTTAAFTPSANAVLFSAFHVVGASTPGAPTFSDSAGLTWNNLFDNAFNSTNRLTVKWAEVGASPANMTVTADYGVFSASSQSWGVVELTGYNTASPVVVGSTATGTGTGTTPATSAVPALSNAADFQLLWVAARSTSCSPEAGWTELFDRAGTQVELACYYIGTPGDTTPSATLPGSAVWRAAALEVATAVSPPSVSGVGTTPRRQALVRRVVVL